jgi:CubicO group peptidase (beta-lactamase class C family)
MRTATSHPIRQALLGVLACCAAVPVLNVLAEPARAAPAACPAPTPAVLAGFFDGTLPARMSEDRIPGVAVSVATGGTTAFAKGYGEADVERGVPFDASRSLVRIASISKLFTWTAVMQQVQAGRLDLDADVNRYLTDFQVPQTFPQPVTLRHLMDHTAGFEDFVIGTAARNAVDVAPLGQYLADRMPARIRPPGEISAYSNYGAALAGYIVTRVSGEPYDGYVQRHLLDPLGMAHSTAAEPVPAALAGDLARSYDTDLDPPKRFPFMFDRMPPDGSVTTTAADMANFMNAHLNGGRFGADRILSAETTARMHQRSFSADPRLDGYAHGFKESTVNGHRVLMHDGGWEGFISVLMLVPGCDLGLFLTTNSLTGAGPAMTELVDAFFDRFAPESAATAATADSSGVAPAAKVRTSGPESGYYKPTRRNVTSAEKVTTLLSPLRLTMNGAGTVHFKGKDWTPQGDGLYRATDGGERLVFLAGTDGRRYVATDGSSYELMTTSETLPVNAGVLLAFLLPTLGIVVLPFGWLLRRLRGRPNPNTTVWRLARALAAGSALLGVTFLAGLLATLTGDPEDFFYGTPLGFLLLLGMPILMISAATAATALTAHGWRDSSAGVLARIHQVSVLAGLTAFIWFLWQWNLLGWQVP